MLFVHVLIHMCACCSELLNILLVVMKKNSLFIMIQVYDHLYVGTSC
jgi:hypothetical protein